MNGVEATNLTPEPCISANKTCPSGSTKSTSLRSKTVFLPAKVERRYASTG